MSHVTDDILLNKAAIIERCLARIREEYLGHEHELETNLTRHDSIVLNMQRACEAAIDLAMHMVRVRALGLPQESREAFVLLQQAGLIDDPLSKRMQAMVGFRNIAVHAYQKLSLPILKSILDTRPDDFKVFSAVMMRHTGA
jgi:uncharacterized protein YutE (UPF0331/DUF86 family)